MGKRNGSGRPPAIESGVDLPTDLEELVSDAWQAARDLRLAEAENAHRIALLAQASTGRRLAGGGSAVEACAKRLGLARTTLQPFSALARCWSRQELRAIFARTHTGCLSISHLLLVSQLPRSARNRWIRDLLMGGCGVRELRSTLLNQEIKNCRTVRQSTERASDCFDGDTGQS
jgi:hypothetical protein